MEKNTFFYLTRIILKDSYHNEIILETHFFKNDSNINQVT